MFNVMFGHFLPLLLLIPALVSAQQSLTDTYREPAGLMARGCGGADIGPLMKDGVPGLGLNTVGEHYFDAEAEPHFRMPAGIQVADVLTVMRCTEARLTMRVPFSSPSFSNI